MTAEAIADLSQRTFRAGSAYDLVVFDRLSPNEQLLLAELRADPDFYGVLRPRPESGRTIKAVGKETALLWMTLQSAGPLPFFAFGNNGAGSDPNSLYITAGINDETGGLFARISAVPEPQTVALVGTGLVGLLVTARRRRARR